jgi:hypothetical protein
MNTGVLPINNKLTIYRGTAGSFLLSFIDASGAAMDLTGKTFIAQARARSGGPLLLDMTVTGTNLAGGQITLSWTAADTAALRPARVQWGLLDSDDIYWIDDVCIIKGKIPE